MNFEKLGPYRLSKKLGQGGMGAVYQGVDETNGERAAVKVLAPQLAGDDGFRIRFQAEIESLKKLRHPNIVRLLGYGEENDSLFYAMELVQGSSLEDELRAGRRFDWREVTDLAIKLCRALKHAHDSGVIHRDIKPANLLLSEDGQIKLSDFGIARLFGNTRLTSDGGVLGTAEYMAPEQADGRVVTDRCDQYSLGGVLYALLAGRPPFRASSFVEMLQLQRFAEPEPVRRYAPDTPAELDQIIRQLLDKEPQKRFANAMILGRALESMQRGLSLGGPTDRDDFIVTPQTDFPPGHTVDPLAATAAPTEAPLTPAKPSVSAKSQPPKSQPLKPSVPAKGQTTPAKSQTTPIKPKSPSVTDPVHSRTVAHSQASKSRTTAEASTSETQGPGRFIKVEEKRDERTWSDDLIPVLSSWQTWAIVAALAAIGFTGWYLMQPLTADALYARIEHTINPADANTLQAARTSLTDFLRLYPDDDRATTAQDYLDQADELRAQKQQNLKNRQLNRAVGSRSTVERAYREALFYKAHDPDQALLRFGALLDLYGSTANADEKQWIDLASKEMEMLKNQLVADHAQDLAAIETQLAEAEKRAANDPAAAAKIYGAIVTLYSDKPWASDAVAKAKAALAGTTGPAGSQQ